jgi:hypothetical protein
MSAALLRKEWREHRAAWLTFNFLLGLVLVVSLLGQREDETKGSLFGLLALPSVLLSTVGALFMAHRLMVREYGQRTQLFLETLPLSRRSILATKLGLGAGALLLPLGLCLLWLADMAQEREQVTPRLLSLLALRAGTPVLLGWSFFALAGVVGRYRNPLYLFTAIALLTVDTLTELELTEVGPFALLGSDFAFERQRIPWEHLGPCWALSAGAVLLCFGLVLYRDGTLTELLSQRMSHREKVFIACVFVGLFTVVLLMDEAQKRKPFALHEAEKGEAAQLTVQVAPGVGFPSKAARQLAERLAEDLAALRAYLALEQLPSVAVLPTRELDAQVFQRAKLEELDGVVVRANLADPGFDLRAFEAFLFREVLIWASKEVVLREERQWLLDGFTTLWASRDEPQEQLMLQAAVASREGLDTSRWLTTRERVGPCLSGALAAQGLVVLRERLGAPAFRTLMQRTLAHSPGTGLWGRWREPRMEVLLREQGGLSQEELLQHWEEALRGKREAHARVLEELSRLRPSLSLVADSEETFHLEHSLHTPEGVAAGSRYALLYHPLDPFGAEVPAHEFSRQDVTGTPGQARLPQGLARGERWLFVLQVEPEALGCPVRLLVERKEVPW